MRRTWGLIGLLVISALVLGVACGAETSGGEGRGPDSTDGGGVGVEELRPKAAAITDQLAGHEWAQVRAEFDDTMKRKLAEDGLASAWEQVVKAKGAYQSRGEPKQVGSPAGQPILVFDTPLQFERGAMKSRISFREDGKIAGLFILMPEA